MQVAARGMSPLLMLMLCLTGDAADTRTVEHEVTDQQAQAALRQLNLTQLEGEGCKPCTESQKGYCLSEDLITDHCTCDSRHVERLPYVAHTCYVPDRVQPTYAADCLEYARLLECCCHGNLLPLMKKKTLNKSNSSTNLYSSSLLLVFFSFVRWLS